MTESQYLTAKSQIDAYNSASNAYIATNGNGIPTEITKGFPFADVVTNDLRSEVETYEFINNPPDKYFLYINEKKSMATTWTGQNLGSVTFGAVWTDNFGGQRQTVWIQAINGLKYHGVYYKSSGNYARVKQLRKT